MLGNSDARHVGADFLEFTSVRVRGVWFHVKRIHVAGSAGQAHVNSRLGFAGNGARFSQAQVIRQAKPSSDKSTSLEEIPSKDSVTTKFMFHGSDVRN
jgi:hypothetical protein